MPCDLVVATVTRKFSFHNLHKDWGWPFYYCSALAEVICALTCIHAHTGACVHRHTLVKSHLYTHSRHLERVREFLDLKPSLSKCITLHFIYFLFKNFFQLYCGIIYKNCIYLRCIRQCFDVYIPCKIITINLINIFIHHEIMFDCVYVCVWWEHLRSTQGISWIQCFLNLKNTSPGSVHS